MHPVAIAVTKVAVSARANHPVLARDSVLQISFNGMRLLETLLPSSPDRPMDQRAAIGGWFGNQDVTQFFPPTSSGMSIGGNQLVAVSTAVSAGGRVI